MNPQARAVGHSRKSTAAVKTNVCNEDSIFGILKRYIILSPLNYVPS